jgi:hypothetical protein
MVDSYTHQGSTLPPQQSSIVLDPITPGVAGSLNVLSVSGASPASSVGFLAGVGSGSTQIPGCAGTLPVGSLRLVGFATANSSGSITLGIWIPRTARGRQFQIWAYDRTTCSISNVIIETF